MITKPYNVKHKEMVPWFIYQIDNQMFNSLKHKILRSHAHKLLDDIQFLFLSQPTKH